MLFIFGMLVGCYFLQKSLRKYFESFTVRYDFLPECNEINNLFNETG